MSNSKTKPKDDSTSKFLQRIAGKKALGPPPTPRPVIGEHPVRTLMRENRDDDETPIQESLIRTDPLLDAATSPVLPTDQPAHMPPISADADIPAVREVDSQKIEAVKSSNLLRDFNSAPVDDEPDQGVDRDKGERNARLARASKEAPGNKTSSEAALSFDASAKSVEGQLNSIKNKYRLNVGEFALYKELYLMTHAIGKTECSFVVSELMKSTDMLERRVRDNIRRLKKNGWIVLLEAYDFENREKAKYRINIEPGV